MMAIIDFAVIFVDEGEGRCSNENESMRPILDAGDVA